MSFWETENTKRANKVIKPIAKQFLLPEYSYGIDEENGDVLIFFPVRYLDNMEEKDSFLSKVKRAWENSNFILKEEEILKAYTYTYISFSSYFFRLSSK